jgi:hypothetical protein
MEEPALVAVIGVGGIIVGAVGSGAVQTLIARSERKRHGRNAARQLYIQLHDAERAVSDLRGCRDWAQMITDWEAYAVSWARYSDPLSAVLSTSRFTTVTSAFACLASLGRSRKHQAPQPMPPMPSPVSIKDQLLGVYLQTIQRAKRMMIEASFRWWEVRAREEALTAKSPLELPPRHSS